MNGHRLQPVGWLIDLGFWLSIFAVVLSCFDWRVGLGCAVAAMLALSAYRIISRKRAGP